MPSKAAITSVGMTMEELQQKWEDTTWRVLLQGCQAGGWFAHLCCIVLNCIVGGYYTLAEANKETYEDIKASLGLSTKPGAHPTVSKNANHCSITCKSLFQAAIHPPTPLHTGRCNWAERAWIVALVPSGGGP